MSQQSLKYSSLNGVSQGNDSSDRQGLGHEKLGVIAGFLVGLPVGIGLVDSSLMTLGAPGWLGLVATLASVAVCTSVGLKAGKALGQRSNQAS